MILAQVLVGILAVAVCVVAHETGLTTDRHIIALGAEKFLVRCSAKCSRIIAIHQHTVIVVAETGIV